MMCMTVVHVWAVDKYVLIRIDLFVRVFCKVLASFFVYFFGGVG